VRLFTLESKSLQWNEIVWIFGEGDQENDFSIIEGGASTVVTEVQRNVVLEAPRLYEVTGHAFQFCLAPAKQFPATHKRQIHTSPTLPPRSAPAPFSCRFKPTDINKPNFLSL
jgi:hypothetical protein